MFNLRNPAEKYTLYRLPKKELPFILQSNSKFDFICLFYPDMCQCEISVEGT
jgi:hypothetical protein